MSIRYSPLTLDTLSVVKDFLLPFWERTWDEDLCDRIFRWRFLERSDSEAILALDGDRCIAMLDSWIRRYIVHDEITHVRETADWYSLPGYRGVGLQPIWMMMKKPEPMVAIGGTDATQNLLPRLKWRPMSQPVRNFLLRLGSGVLLENPIKRTHLPGSAALVGLAHRLSVPIGRVRSQPPPTDDAGMHRLKPSDPLTAVSPARSDYALARLVDRSELEWLYSAPREMGDFSSLVFSLDGKPVGLSVNRLFSRDHSREANILHIQASEVSTRVYAWIASETAAHFARLGAKTIRCRTSCPQLAEALLQTGFRQRSAFTPMWWSQNGEVPTGNALLSMLRADDGILPYPTK